MPAYLDYGFEGKTAIVTGAGTGIGRACALELAKGGVRVALFGRRPEPLAGAREECLKYAPDVLALTADVGNRGSVQNAVGKVLEELGGVDILINNAGIESRLEPGQTFFDDLFDTLDDETYMKFFEVHTLGHYHMNLAVLTSMRERGFGRIVNITSVTGVDGAYSTPAYTASKAAAICQTKAFARKYSHLNILVNSISPGMVDTPMKIDSPPEEYAAVAEMTPIGRVADPIDIARVAMFFAQEHLFVTGQNLIVDGGAHIL